MRVYSIVYNIFIERNTIYFFNVILRIILANAVQINQLRLYCANELYFSKKTWCLFLLYKRYYVK